MFKKLITGIFATLILLSLLTTPVLKAAPPIQTDGQEYIVQAGDWLSKIAEKYYNDPLAYSTIVSATNVKAAEDNSFATITDPNMIETGQNLFVLLLLMVMNLLWFLFFRFVSLVWFITSCWQIVPYLPLFMVIKQAMDQLEKHFERLPGLEKWFIRIRPVPLCFWDYYFSETP